LLSLASRSRAIHIQKSPKSTSLYASIPEENAKSDDAIDSLGDEIARNAKHDETAGDAPEPGEIAFVFLARDPDVHSPLKVKNRVSERSSLRANVLFFCFVLGEMGAGRGNKITIPVIMFMGSTIVPRTVSLPRTSAFCSARSFMRMLI
jgi:hypothetical protein